MASNLYHYKNGINEFEQNDFEQQKKSLSVFINKQFVSRNLVVFIGSGCSSEDIPLMSTTMRKILNEYDVVYKKVRQFLNSKNLDFLNNSIKSNHSWLEKKYENEEDKNRKDSLKTELRVSSNLLDLLEKNNKTSIEEFYDRNKEHREFLDNNFYKSFSDIESLLNWLQNGLNFSPNDSELEEAIRILKREFIDTIPTLGSEVYQSGTTLSTYQKFFQSVFKHRTELGSKVTIVTTNYDLFNEYALENNRIIYSTGFENNLHRKFNVNLFRNRVVDDTNRYKNVWQPTFKEANLLKIHGSINWTSDDNSILIQRDQIMPDESEVIIYPTMLKHKETAQAPYSELFREFANILQVPNTTLIVLGYGFPDEHINNIISQNLRNQDFNLIVFGDKEEDKIKRFFREFEGQEGFHLIGGEDVDNKTKAHYFKYLVDEIINYTLIEELGITEENGDE